MAYADSYLTRKPGGPSKKAKRTPTEIGQTVPTSSKGQKQKTAALSKVSRGKSVSRVYTTSSTATSASSSSSGSRSRPAAPRLSPAERERRRERRLQRQQTRALRRIDRAFDTKDPIRADRKTERKVGDLLKDREAPRKVVITPKLEGRKVKVGKTRVRVSPGVVKRANRVPEQKPQKVRAENPKIQGKQEKRVAKRLTKAAKKSRPKVPVESIPAMGLSREVAPTVKRLAEKRGVRPSLLMGQLEQESGFDPLATEKGGTVSNTPSESQGGGISQFITSTAAQYGVKYGGSKKAVKSQLRGQANYMADLGAAKNESAALGGYYGASDPAYVQGILSNAEKYRALDKPAGKGKPIPKPLKAKAKKVLGEKATKQVVKQAKGTPAKKPGAWAGSKNVVTEAVGKTAISQATSLKRADTVGGASSTSSMHHISQKDAFAADLPYEQPILDRITKKLKIPKMSLGQDYNGSSPVYPGYEIELLTSEHGTGPHIHLGARWGGGELPEGTSLGGAMGSVATGTSSTSTVPSRGGTVSASSPAGGTSKRGKARRRRRRRGETPQERLARVRAVGERLTPAEMSEYGIDPSVESFSEYVKRQPTKVGL